MEKIINFDEYCTSCKYWTIPESEEPCYECLDNPINEDSRKPINYESSEEI